MPGINGSSKAQPMEMETLNPGDFRPPRPHPVDQLLTLIKLYMESYPKITTVIVFSLIGLLMLAVTPNFQSTVVRNRLHHDYSAINENYNFKASQMDHWCLWGGDHDCKCLDFTEPESCAEKPGWVKQHERNKIQGQFDVVFVGDEMVEKMAGTNMGSPTLESKQVAKLFNQTFSKADGGQFDGAALGIAGDATANLIWRLQHGELSPQLSSNIYWLWVGVNDLIDGYCSEEAVVLGILRTAEEFVLQDPGSVVVVQGILPLSKHDGHLTDTGRHSIFPGRDPKAHTVKQAKNQYLFWPSIQAINDELKRFCTKHPRMVYFDAGNLFLGSTGNSVYKGKEEHIIQELMPDYIHPSLNGYKLLLKVIREEVERILLDDNEENDVEEKGSRQLR